MSNRKFLRRYVVLFSLAALVPNHTWATWDDDPSLDDLEFSLESIIDINSYQFHRSQEILWYDVENGLRITAGSLETTCFTCTLICV